MGYLVQSQLSSPRGFLFTVFQASQQAWKTQPRYKCDAFALTWRAADWVRAAAAPSAAHLLTWGAPANTALSVCHSLEKVGKHSLFCVPPRNILESQCIDLNIVKNIIPVFVCLFLVPVDWTLGVLSYIPGPSFIYLFLCLRQGLTELLNCPGWPQACNPPAPASGLAGITGIHYLLYSNQISLFQRKERGSTIEFYKPR